MTTIEILNGLKETNGIDKETIDALDAAIACVRQLTPMAPKLTKGKGSFWLCPKCKRMLRHRDTKSLSTDLSWRVQKAYKWCPDCGQTIDWTGIVD